MVNFHDLGMIRAKNCLPASDTCLYSKPLTCVKVSDSWCGALPFNSHLEMHLQKGSMLCIWSRASWRLPVMDFGVGWLSGDCCGCDAMGVIGVVSGILSVQLLV